MSKQQHADHHHEQRSVAGMTRAEVAVLENIPDSAVFDSMPGDTPMIPGPNGEGEGDFIMEPVLTWRVEDRASNQ
jgi:hypothetical protein